MISPSGRFETGVKICLSMSSHHPEHWQPSWSVRVALVALIAFLPTSGHGAIGSLVRSCLAPNSSELDALWLMCNIRMEIFALRHCEHTSGIWRWFMQDFSKEEKRVLAVESRKAPPKYGSEAKQQIINRLHARMLAAEQASGLYIHLKKDNLMVPCADLERRRHWLGVYCP